MVDGTPQVVAALDVLRRHAAVPLARLEPPQRPLKPLPAAIEASSVLVREIEAHLCRSNGGHLIRIVGPAFERVCGWIDAGIPLQVAVEGIDRKLARYHGSGRKGRPLRIEYCEADILQAFEEWRRAVGVSGGTNGDVSASRDYAVGRSGRHRASLPKHIDRVLAYTTSRLALSESVAGVRTALEELIDKLGILRGSAGAARGKARESKCLNQSMDR